MPNRPDVPCASCGSLMWRGTTSLPPGEAMCRPCRRAVGPVVVPLDERRRRWRASQRRSRGVDDLGGAVQEHTAVCPRCGAAFTTTVDRKRYCTARCKQTAKAARRPKPPPKLRPPLPRCVDCGGRVGIAQRGLDGPPTCQPCRVLQASVRRQELRRGKNAATLAAARPAHRRARLLSRFINHRRGESR